MQGKAKNLKDLKYSSPSEFWKVCVAHIFEDYSDVPKETPQKMQAMFEAAEDLDDFQGKILESTDPDITMTQAYAVLSKRTEGHWYRIRAMMGDRCRKTYSDAGSLKIGNEGFSILLNNHHGDGETRYAVFNREEWNNDMATFETSVEGTFNIYTYDCGDAVAETLTGKYGIYIYDGIVIFEHWE